MQRGHIRGALRQIACLRKFLSVQEISFANVEMPGQYASGNEVSPDGVVHLESISPDVVVVRRHGVSHRRLAFVGSDGRTRYYSIHGSVSWLLGKLRVSRCLA